MLYLIYVMYLWYTGVYSGSTETREGGDQGGALITNMGLHKSNRVFGIGFRGFGFLYTFRKCFSIESLMRRKGSFAGYNKGAVMLGPKIGTGLCDILH